MLESIRAGLGVCRATTHTHRMQTEIRRAAAEKGKSVSVCIAKVPQRTCAAFNNSVAMCCARARSRSAGGKKGPPPTGCCYLGIRDGVVAKAENNNDDCACLAAKWWPPRGYVHTQCAKLLITTA